MKDIKRVGKDAASIFTTGASNYVDKTLNPDAPTIEEPEVAPVADESATKIANRRKAAKRRAGGRAGTILTESNTLG